MHPYLKGIAKELENFKLDEGETIYKAALTLVIVDSHGSRYGIQVTSPRERFDCEECVKQCYSRDIHNP